MPFSEEFEKLKRKYKRLYSDKAKAETFAYEEAFKNDIPTFRDKKFKFKVQKVDFQREG